MVSGELRIVEERFTFAQSRFQTCLRPPPKAMAAGGRQAGSQFLTIVHRNEF